MNRQQVENLLDKYITGDLAPAERQQLAEVLNEPEHVETLENFAREIMLSDNFAAMDHPGVKEAILAHLETKIGQPAGPRRTIPLRRVIPLRRTFIRYAAAAAIILLFSGAWIWFAKREDKIPVVAQTHDIPPGHDGAILTLADGKQIVLDSSRNGSLAMQGNTAITKQNAGQLTYKTATAAPSEIMYNTLTTPRGRRTSVVLSDGTRVWLNALSSIKFPTVFSGRDRAVEITGEAYFEVAKNTAMPFKVKIAGPGLSKNFEIQVLGTSFNIMAYNDENAISTTLVEGSVKVVSGPGAKLITPGQQLIAGSDGQLQLVPDADVQKVIAWKDGNFLFRGDELSSIMKQLSRWYDIDVRFDGTLNDHYTGKISRQVNISQVLKMLEAAGGVSFSVQNKEVKVLPKTM